MAAIFTDMFIHSVTSYPKSDAVSRLLDEISSRSGLKRRSVKLFSRSSPKPPTTREDEKEDEEEAQQKEQYEYLI